MLISAGADARRSETVLHSLLDNLDFNVSLDQVRVLIDAGAPLDTTDFRGRTVLEVAASRGHSAEVINLLIGATTTPKEPPTATPSPTPQPAAALTLRGSGTLYADVSDGLIGCPARTDEPAFVSSRATSGGVEFSFEVPDTSTWSIGLLYHIEGRDTDTATFVYGSADAAIGVGHWTRVSGQNVHSVKPIAVASSIFDATEGALNTVAITTDQDGTAVELNETLVWRVPITELRPRRGAMQVCVGAFTEEREDYLIDYVELRAWTE